ncbi:S-formylglutathione hydrolase [Chromobacterium alkanivorans]|nr:S-formylglutathione hydrolase [Chromobacterium alkanivorans]MCS3817285.1 S-formylglutathione hydrolase [Chromobacterium alkanivorans]MCS3872325.1 S-formylglutathione hydrolase [Chromobacterium alkanivorans]
MNLENISANKSFGGWHRQYLHDSETLDCRMRFAVYLPPQAGANQRVPVLYWLSGLTCTDENFMQKAGAQRVAAELGLAIVAPDTSPRGAEAADDEAFDLGQGAGFYLNATQAPWDRHYRMYDYVSRELPALIEANFPVTAQRAVAGHSMGGHGALICALKRPQDYVSASAFSPICHPVNAPWGQKAFAAYLGEDRAAWEDWDASLLLKHARRQLPLRVDIGLADSFLDVQLQPEALETAARDCGYPLELYRHAEYDHSYYFVASLIEEQLRFHARHLGL